MDKDTFIFYLFEGVLKIPTHLQQTTELF